jgi:hypothetical protein
LPSPTVGHGSHEVLSALAAEGFLDQLFAHDLARQASDQDKTHAPHNEQRCACGAILLVRC